MQEQSAGDTVAVLEELEQQLDAHFTKLSEQRRQIGGEAPVFALEHCLSAERLGYLKGAVRTAIAQGFGRPVRRHWLPFVVYATEIGYSFDGLYYWPKFCDSTPGWSDSQSDRRKIRDWFEKFRDKFGGATPKGAWAETFKFISWPVTHAVLPAYLQKQVANLLSDHASDLASLLDDPETLGYRLASWAPDYSDRLRIFSQNRELLGQVAIALLLPDREDNSSYLATTTLARILEDLSCERQARNWLKQAQSAANRVLTSGIVTQLQGAQGRSSATRRLPAVADPQMQLRLEGNRWRLYAILPDMRALRHDHASLFEELRSRRASISGSRELIHAGGLLFANPPIALSTWPAIGTPFIHVHEGSAQLNDLLAEQCRISDGPVWVFRLAPAGPAVEVKGKFVRPGGRYCVVAQSDASLPQLSWSQRAEIDIDGYEAAMLDVPAALAPSDAALLVAAGISVVTRVSVQPVGVIPRNWDGEGSVEWMAGEPAFIRIHADQPPQQCKLSIGGASHLLSWPVGETGVFVKLDRLGAGSHELTLSLTYSSSEEPIFEGSLLIVVRDPDRAADTSSVGEGIRLRSSPAQPSLDEVWNGRAFLEVDGPRNATALIALVLLSSDGSELCSVQREVRLPLCSNDWPSILARLRSDDLLTKRFDEADALELVVRRAGVGFARLFCERGLRGLRWIIRASHDRGFEARLIDQTDSSEPQVDFFPMQEPLNALRQSSSEFFVSPPRGGLIRAVSTTAVATQIVPPDFTEVFKLGPVQPDIPVRERSAAEARRLINHHAMWMEAALPSHPIARSERNRVLDSITSVLAAMLAPGYWAEFEKKVRTTTAGHIKLKEVADLVQTSPKYTAMTAEIKNNMWQWSSAEKRIVGFAGAIADVARQCGITDSMTAARFLLQLASAPGELSSWDPGEIDFYLEHVIERPVLLRAARFAVLGTADEIPG